MIFADSAAIASNFSTILNIILSFAALSLGALSIRNRYEKGNDAEAIQNLKDSNSAFATRRQADQIVIEARDAEILLLKQQNEVYKNTVTQAPDITKLIKSLATQHKENALSNKSIIEGLGNVAKELGRLAKSMNKEPDA